VGRGIRSVGDAIAGEGPFDEVHANHTGGYEQTSDARNTRTVDKIGARKNVQSGRCVQFWRPRATLAAAASDYGRQSCGGPQKLRGIRRGGRAAR